MASKRTYRGIDQLTGRDKIVVALMVVVPTLLVLWLVWLPAVGSVLLSFTNWDGIGPLSGIESVGPAELQGHRDDLPAVLAGDPAQPHLVGACCSSSPRRSGCSSPSSSTGGSPGTKFYQTSIYLPVVLSLALIGFIWQLIYSRDQGLINAITGGTTDWYGDPSVNLWATLVEATWRHAGYIMLLYLAGLKGVDPSLREAAKIDGASETATFFRVILPVMRPINIIVLVVTFIESLRAFDLVWVINKGRNGLELISTLVTQNVVGEASRIGFGSALATIMLAISSVLVVIYLRIAMKED